MKIIRKTALDGDVLISRSWTGNVYLSYLSGDNFSSDACSCWKRRYAVSESWSSNRDWYSG